MMPRVAQELSLERPVDGVALLTLDRPDKRNALSLDLREQLTAALGELAADQNVACIVVTGAGRAFCAGMDTGEFGGDRANRERIVEASVAAFRAVGEHPKPLVAAINGPAVAGGFALALLCDLRIASESARMWFGEPPRGIPASYAAARSALPAVLARDLCLTGRAVDADEAARLGVVSETVPVDALMPRALELAAAIAASPRAALAGKRRILVERHTLWAPLFEAEERELRAALLAP